MTFNKKFALSLLSIGLAFFLAGCPSPNHPKDHSMMHEGQSNASIHIHDSWVRAVPPVSHMSAAYMTLINESNKTDQLLSVKSDIAEVIEIHNVIKTGEMMEMVPVPFIEIPAGGVQQLKQGGYHIMLIRLTRNPKVGDSVELTLNFKLAGEIKVVVPVIDGKPMKKMNGDSMDHNSMNHSN